MVDRMNIYQSNGYENREDYLKTVAEAYNVPLSLVKDLATLMGEKEDFRGLIDAVLNEECMI